MNLQELRIAQARFSDRIDTILEERKPLYKLRNRFVKYFDENRIAHMRLEDYVIGLGIPANGLNFCYSLEWLLDGLGRITGSTAFKFGIYYGQIASDPLDKYRYTKKFGSSPEEAFANIKSQILSLLAAGHTHNLNAIQSNLISDMFKGKILSTYFPDTYLNIFSSEHLNYYLKELHLNSKESYKADASYKKQILTDFKNSDPVMKTWSLDIFAYFLYSVYPGAPINKNGNHLGSSVDLLEDYKKPVMPDESDPEFIELIINPPKNSEPKIPDKGQDLINHKRDYDKEAFKQRMLGDIGEKIVFDLEKKRLSLNGREDLADKINRVSLKSDAYGYDIKSFEIDGSERLIEVKATQSKVGKTSFFFTANEFREAMKHPNYYIYMVFDVLSKSPKIWPIKNPFNPLNNSTRMTPVNYRVHIKSST